MKTHRKTELLTLVRAEHSFRDIEGRLGIRRETVSKYAGEAGLWPPPVTATPEAWQAGLSKPATPGLEVATGFGDPVSIASLVPLPISEAFLSSPGFEPVCSDGERAGIQEENHKTDSNKPKNYNKLGLSVFDSVLRIFAYFQLDPITLYHRIRQELFAQNLLFQPHRVSNAPRWIRIF